MAELHISRNLLIFPRGNMDVRNSAISLYLSVADTCRNILIFPRGNREVTNSTISLYLNVADNESAPVGWSRTAKFTLSVVDQRDPDKSASKGTYKFMLQYGLSLPEVFTRACGNTGSAIQRLSQKSCCKTGLAIRRQSQCHAAIRTEPILYMFRHKAQPCLSLGLHGAYRRPDRDVTSEMHICCRVLPVQILHQRLTLL